MKHQNKNKKVELKSNQITSSTLIIDGQEVTRQEQLVLWLRRHGISFCELGRRLGISDVSMRRICRAETAPVARVEALIAEGIPKELLPTPLNRVPGRKPKEWTQNNQIVSASEGI